MLYTEKHAMHEPNAYAVDPDICRVEETTEGREFRASSMYKVVNKSLRSQPTPNLLFWKFGATAVHVPSTERRSNRRGLRTIAAFISVGR